LWPSETDCGRAASWRISSKEEFATAISPGQHGTTFGGGPLACRVALEFLRLWSKKRKLLENVNKVGAYLQQGTERPGGKGAPRSRRFGDGASSKDSA